MRRECFICTGDLVPNDNGLEMPETQLRGQNGWIITTIIRCSKVLVKLEGSVDDTDDPRAIHDLVAREAQHIAQMWLSAIGFAEGSSYSTRISTIEDSIGRMWKLGPKPVFWPHGEDLGIGNEIEIARGAAVLSITNEHFRRALHDYLTALNFAPDSSFYLYRALDALRKHFDDKWTKMHQSLGTSKSKIDALITPYANKIRHGESLDLQELLKSYREHHSAAKYVRDALLIFLIKNSQSNFDLPLPDLDRIIIPNMSTCLDKNK